MGSTGGIERSTSTTIDGMIFPAPPDFIGPGDGCLSFDSLPVERSRMCRIAFNVSLLNENDTSYTPDYL